MRISKDLDNPVRASWFADQSYRLDASPYLSGAYEARKLLERLPKTVPLGLLTRQHNGVFHAGRVSRRWVTDRNHGVPFFSSTDILEADYSHLPLISKKSVQENPKLTIRRDWILITRSGTVGRMAYARPDIDGYACSEHVLRVVANQGVVLPGYLYAFLASPYGIPMVVSQASGSIIQHIEPDYIVDLPVPRFEPVIEGRIHKLIQEAADLRAKAQTGVTHATRDLFESAGLPELADFAWHKQSRATGFTVQGITTASLRALNYDARARRIADLVRGVDHISLGEICAEGELARGNRFSRIPVDRGNGVRLIGQEHIFWLRPEERWIALKPGEIAQLRVVDETIMVACQGLLTERSLIGRAAFVSGSWTQYVYSEHLLRVRSGIGGIPNAYLFAFLRSEAAFRMLRSLCAGTGPQDINYILRKQIPVPLCAPEDRERIAETVRQAYRWRDEADMKEDQALALLGDAVREAAG
ncbi:restriction endonuclease subunit S [Microbispora sp. SCL1-1]|uniref:methylation-associated defense system restriction endonuclease subunit S MAD5 n=1 Tax=unclassified Microbispora TaxID=2614687 RepID=UPI00115AB141|nr:MULTISPECIES: restriction endonuclease subunit S [unclassified Microbispora]NJP29900.1 restriction endonuclease subunit S [Microbispora sp. CL1-1]TQS03803.1 restriction endonuclease subunit S [Microbispora sp. SCL1-1]